MISWSCGAYFQDANAALAPQPGTCSGCPSLPTTNFMIQQDSGNWMTVDTTGPYGGPGASLLLFKISGLQRQLTFQFTNYFTEAFNLNLTGIQSIASGSYVGTLFLQARILSAGGPVKAESDAISVNLVVNSPSSLTISVTPGAVYWNASHGNSLTPGNGTNVGVPDLTLTLTWHVAGNVSTIPVYVFFSDPQTALTSILGSSRIPASSFLMRVDAGSYQPVLPSPGAIGFKCAEVAITDANRSGTQSYQLRFNINLSSMPLPAGDYAGRLYLQAEAAL